MDSSEMDSFENPFFETVASKKQPLFYIDVDTSCGWPYNETSPICKFGITRRDPGVRCRENELILKRKWRIEAELEICFLATGAIACEDIEERVRDHTLAWRPEGFSRQAEWRCCSPRQLARVAVLVTERQCYAEGSSSG